MENIQQDKNIYLDVLLKNNTDISKIRENIRTIKDISDIEYMCAVHFHHLKNADDMNTLLFEQNMGKFEIGINRMEDLQIPQSEQSKIIDVYRRYHEKFTKLVNNNM